MGRPGRPKKKKAEAVVKDIKRQTRRKFNAEEKIRIVLEGLKGESSEEDQIILKHKEK